jgi:hypothetical protein
LKESSRFGGADDVVRGVLLLSWICIALLEVLGLLVDMGNTAAVVAGAAMMDGGVGAAIAWELPLRE